MARGRESALHYWDLATNHSSSASAPLLLFRRCTPTVGPTDLRASMEARTGNALDGCSKENTLLDDADQILLEHLFIDAYRSDYSARLSIRLPAVSNSSSR